MMGIRMTNMYSISSLPTTLSTIPPTIQHKNNTEKLENNPQERKLIHELKEMNIEDNSQGKSIKSNYDEYISDSASNACEHPLVEDWTNSRGEDEDKKGVIKKEDNNTVFGEGEEEEEGGNLNREAAWDLYLTKLHEEAGYLSVSPDTTLCICSQCLVSRRVNTICYNSIVFDNNLVDMLREWPDFCIFL